MRMTRSWIWGLLLVPLLIAALGLVSAAGAQAQRAPDTASLEAAVVGQLDAPQVLVTESAFEGEWAAGGLVEVRDGQLVEGEGTVFVAHWNGAAWDVLIEGTAEFRALLPQVPDTLLAAHEKERLDYESIHRNAPLDPPAQPQASGYKLPWPAGVSYRLSGAWATGPCPHGVPPYTSHAIDVGMPIGSRIVAAKAGVVYLVRESSNACGCSSSVPGNWVAVRHEPDDGLTDWYIHLAQGGAAVEVGQQVKQGDTIGYSHQIGYTCGGGQCDPGTCSVADCRSFPHLHFHVENSNRERVYITFDDVGAVVGCTWYTSGNTGAPDPDVDPPTPPDNLRAACGNWFGSFTSTPRPCFAWDASTDESGVRGYYAAIDDASPDGEGSNDEWVGTSLAWTVPNNLGEGPRFFRVAAEEDTENRLRSYSEPFTFTVDTRAPDNPTHVDAGCTTENNLWQNECYDPDFSWDGASDGDGSGIKDYAYYWGPSALGEPAVYTTGTSYDPEAITSEDGCAVAYLNMAVRDNLDQESVAGPAFVLRYDGGAPIANMIINSGTVTTSQVTVRLGITVVETCSQVADVRVTNDGLDWSDWSPFKESLLWHLPAQDQTMLTVTVQVRDVAGNESEIAEDSIYLDLYTPQPRSETYLLCAATLDAGGQIRGSDSYSLTDAIGELGAGAGSPTYTMESGLLATVGGCPVTAPLSLPVTAAHSLVALNGGLESPITFRLAGLNEPPPSSGATPDSQGPHVENGRFGIRSGELGLGYTNRVTTTLSLWAPGASELQVDTAPAFTASSWQPFATPLTWYYAPDPALTAGTHLYARFRDDEGTVYGTFETTLFYDGVAPSVSFELVETKGRQATLALEVDDDYAGVHQVRVGASPVLSDSSWLPYSDTLTVDIVTGVPVYLQVRDRAGNPSEAVQVYAPGDYAVYLPVVIRNR